MDTFTVEGTKVWDDNGRRAQYRRTFTAATAEQARMMAERAAGDSFLFFRAYEGAYVSPLSPQATR